MFIPRTGCASACVSFMLLPNRCGARAQLDNVLLDGASPRPNIKLCDFGYSKDEVTQSVCKTACGTPEYMSPEVCP